MNTCKYPKNVFDTADYQFNVLKRSTNKKLGRKVTKGRHKDKPFYTLHLEVRKNCPSSCFHWNNCYDDNMPFAHRFKYSDTLMVRIWKELTTLDKKHPQGFLVRLHVGGDFPSVEYVKFWEMALLTFSTLSCYGYTHHHYNRKRHDIDNIGISWKEERNIGKAIKNLRDKMWDRFSVRFSDLLEDELSANSKDLTEEGITCPEQLGKTASCGTCTLCWNKEVKSVLFITH
tara:strand:- start:4359 stop:5048 length:690 start_codon:yes stop_codon:yes gene_type:complete